MAYTYVHTMYHVWYTAAIACTDRFVSTNSRLPAGVELASAAAGVGPY